MEPAPPLCRLEGRRVFVAGHSGLVGSALLRRLRLEDCDVVVASRDEMELRRQSDVEEWFAEVEPDIVFVAAGTVAEMFVDETRPAELLYDNLLIASNIFEASRKARVEKLLYLGASSCYPPRTTEPLHEDALLEGPVDPASQWYALAKITALRLCAAYRRQWDCDFISCQPANVYGPGGRAQPPMSSFVSNLVARTHAARSEGSVVLNVPACGWWRREFLYVDDLADACIFLMKRYSHEDHINVGWGRDTSIAELAKLIAEIVEYQGDLQFDQSQSNGSPRQLLDVSRIGGLGWSPSTPLREGIARTYAWHAGREMKPVGEGAAPDSETAAVPELVG